MAQPAHISSSSAVVAAARQHKFGIGVTSVIVVLLVAAAAYGIYAYVSRTRLIPFQNSSVHKITETGKASLVAISPDGKYILSVVEDKGQHSLWLRNVPTNSNAQVMPPEPVQYLRVQFSPDGNYLYFVRGEPGQALKFPALSHRTRKSGAPLVYSSGSESGMFASRPAPFDLVHALANPLLDAFVGGVVVSAVAQVVGQALHVGDFALQVVRVLVSLAVSEALHQPGRRIAQMQRHRIGAVRSTSSCTAP